MQHFYDLLPIFHLKLRLIAGNGDISVMRMLSVNLHSLSLIYVCVGNVEYPIHPSVYQVNYKLKKVQFHCEETLYIVNRCVVLYCTLQAWRKEMSFFVTNTFVLHDTRVTWLFARFILLSRCRHMLLVKAAFVRFSI